MTPLSITLVGDQPAVLLTNDLLEKLNVSIGDEVQAIITANGIELVRAYFNFALLAKQR